jgi:hypothetical protein
MESGGFTQLASSIFLGLSLALGVGLLIDATARWIHARSLWAQVIAREALTDNGAWSRVKVWTDQRRLFERPIYALMYAEDANIRIESRDPIDDTLITILDRERCASHWRHDCVEFKTGKSSLRIKAVGTGLPVSSIQQTDAFWQRVQPQSADPFNNGDRQIQSLADRRSKLVFLALGVITLVALIDTSFLNAFWLISGEPYTRFWWVPVIAAMPMAICMVRDLVPPVETGAAALMLAVGFAIGGYTGVKRVDQWVSTPTQQLYELRMSGGRMLVPVNASGPNIPLRSASPLWKQSLVGSQHLVTIHGGVLGTTQVNYNLLLPGTRLASLTN